MCLPREFLRLLLVLLEPAKLLPPKWPSQAWLNRQPRNIGLGTPTCACLNCMGDILALGLQPRQNFLKLSRRHLSMETLLLAEHCFIASCRQQAACATMAAATEGMHEPAHVPQQACTACMLVSLCRPVAGGQGSARSALEDCLLHCWSSMAMSINRGRRLQQAGEGLCRQGLACPSTGAVAQQGEQEGDNIALP